MIILFIFRNLQEPNASLATLAKRFGLSKDTQKGLFPHSSNTSVRKLKNSSQLPTHASGLWFDSLHNRMPSPEEVHDAQQDFVRIKGQFRSPPQPIQSQTSQSNLIQPNPSQHNNIKAGPKPGVPVAQSVALCARIRYMQFLLRSNLPALIIIIFSVEN